MNPISELNLEGTALALLDAWLATWFDGKPHAFGGNTQVSFPLVSLRYAQSHQPQPISGVGITTVFLGLAGERRTMHELVNAHRQLMAVERCEFLFYVRAAVNAAVPGASPGENAQSICQRTAGLLAALLRNPAATRALSQHGLRRATPDASRAITEDAAYILRTLRCRALLRYPILLNPTP